MIKFTTIIKHYPDARAAHKDRPSGFSFLSCLKNYFSTIKNGLSEANINVETILLCDGHEEEFAAERELISQYPDLHVVLLYKNLRDPWATYYWAYDLATINERSNDEFIYMLENDYLHSSAWLKKIEELITSKIKTDYISLYDHPDKYFGHKSFNLKYSRLKSQIQITDSHYWRTTPSTCGSFIASVKVLREDRLFYKVKIKDRFRYPLLRYLKKRILVSPMPSLSSHQMVDLNEVFSK